MAVSKSARGFAGRPAAPVTRRGHRRRAGRGCLMSATANVEHKLTQLKLSRIRQVYAE